MLSLNQAGRLVGISGSAISHMEHGRMDISRARKQTLVSAYEYTMGEFLDFLDGGEIPKNLRDECITMLRRCEESKIQILYPVLLNLAK